MKRWTGWIVVGVLALAVGAALVTHPWSEPRIPTASEYSSASDLARDLNEHGLGCAQPTQTRLLKLLDRYLAIFIDRRFVPETLACSVDGRPVAISVLPPAAFKYWFSPEPTPRWDFQDAVAQANDGLETMLVGPNWMVMARQERDAIPVLSSIRDEIGGTLTVAASPTTSPSALSPTLHGWSS
jgi:hypothetical protein